MMRYVLTFAIVGIALCANADIQVSSGFCGKDRHMEFVDPYGRALELYRLGEFELADTRIPLYAYWSSADDASKSMLGYGWHVPWFECRMIPIDASRYELRSMFGERVRFVKDTKNPKLYRLRQSACATVVKNTVKVYLRASPNGAPDMVFVGGRLVQFVYASRTFKLSYENGMFSRLSVGGRILMSVDRKTQSPNVLRICFNGKKNDCASVCVGKKFVCVGNSSGGPVMSERETVVGIVTDRGERFVFSYGVENGRGRMFDGRTEIMWDPETRTISTHGEWTYDVVGHDPDMGVYRLRRFSVDGKEESYSYDAKTGHRVKVYGGVRDVARRFTSGKLRGMMRWHEIHGPGSYATRTEYTYNEKLRAVYFKIVDLRDNSYSEYWKDSSDRLAKVRRNGDDSTTEVFHYAADGSRTVERIGAAKKQAGGSGI